MLILNKKAQFNYFLFDRHEAGISLMGGEARSIRNHNADLSNSFVKIIGNEAFLVNANIPIEGKLNYDSTRSRKLLLHKKEIISILSNIKAKKLTLVPTKMYNKGRKIKLEIALAKTKRKFEKKESIKKKDIEKEIAISLSEQFKNK